MRLGAHIICAHRIGGHNRTEKIQLINSGCGTTSVLIDAQNEILDSKQIRTRSRAKGPGTTELIVWTAFWSGCSVWPIPDIDLFCLAHT